MALNPEKKQIATLVKFASQRVEQQQGKPLDLLDQSILEQALQGVKLVNIEVSGLEKTTIKTCRAPALWKMLSNATNQKVGIKNVQQVLKAAYAAEQPVEQPPTGIPQSAKQPAIFNHLPAPTCTRFVGRSADLDRLMELLSPDHAAHLITISGIGGMGKTSLALEAAQRCFAASQKPIRADYIPRFEMFLFVSAKLSHLGLTGLIPRLDPARSLTDILLELADALDIDVSGLDQREQMRRLRKELQQKRTLLIVDNLETVENQRDVLGFLTDLPRSVKVILTTREQRGYSELPLTALTEQDTLSLIKYETEARKLALTRDQQQELCKATCGVPLALNYVMGQLQSGYKFGSIVNGIGQPTHQVAQYCFEAIVQPMRGKPPHQILMALALLPAPVLEAALVEVAIPEAQQVASTALDELRDLMLVEQIDCRYGGSSVLVRQTEYRYRMHPMTQKYMLAELQNCPTFAAAVRDRWINWYLELTQPYADRDATLWQTQFNKLSPEWINLQAIADWLIAAEQSKILLRLWRNLEPYTYAMGRERMRPQYWAIRLEWTGKLIQAFTEQGDWRELPQLMLERAWTLVATRNAQLLPEAEELFQKIWDLKGYQTDQFLMNVALKRGILYVEKNDFATAEAWFKETESLMTETCLNEQEEENQIMRLKYYLGMCKFQNQQPVAAKPHFEAARQIAQSLQDERMLRMAENWLGDIAREEGNFEQANQLLEEGLRVSKSNQDLPLSAFSHRSLAKLYGDQKNPRKNLRQAQKHATEAIKQFRKLEMTSLAENTQNWLNQLEAEVAGQKPTLGQN
jgi:tetratricopeptide (TPR) repeat protein